MKSFEIPLRKLFYSINKIIVYCLKVCSNKIFNISSINVIIVIKLLNVFVLYNIVSVSYTHLDVYKRQELIKYSFVSGIRVLQKGELQKYHPQF